MERLRRMGAQAKQRPTPAPLYTAKREAATDKKPPKPPRLAVTAARKNSGGYERQGQVSPSSEDVILYPFRSSTSKAGMRVFAAAEIFMCLPNAAITRLSGALLCYALSLQVR